MKKKYYLVGTLLAGFILLTGFVGRHWLMGLWEEYTRPNLPAAIAFQEKSININTDLSQSPPSPIEGGTASSENFILESSPQNESPLVDPLQILVDVPSEINLAVPWMSQAPHANWDFPYQEACEEASMIMVDAFYKGRTERLDINEADEAVKKLVAYQNDKYGDYKDTDVAQTAKIIKDYFGYKDVRVLSFKTTEDIKNILVRGYPVIIPFFGKALKNPNYRNDGPLYHMMVVKGYTDDGLFITGDPGTRKGEDYVYPYSRIIEAAHDWNGGDVMNGAKLMIVVLPNV